MRTTIRASLPAIVLGLGLLTAPIEASADIVDIQLQLDDSAHGFFAHYLKNGVEQLTDTFCGTGENCSLGEGFYVASPSIAVNSTVNFNVYEKDGTTLSDFGTATFDYESNGGLQDFIISLNSKIDGFPLISPFTAADDPISLIETGAYQTVSSISGVPGSDGNTYNVDLEFRSDVSVPEPSTLALLGAGLLALVGFGWRSYVRI